MIKNGQANQAAKTSAAYRALAASHAGLLFDGYKKAADNGEVDRVFLPRSAAPFGPNDVVQFSEAYSGTMRDMRTCGVAALHCGIPVYLLKKKQALINSHFPNTFVVKRANQVIQVMRTRSLILACLLSVWAHRSSQ